ncbi:hypothetical protein ACS0TY_014776 [Phlomoides rotata]
MPWDWRKRRLLKGINYWVKLRWIKEGGVNSKFFHGWINKKNKVNGTEGLLVDNTWIESVDGVKEAVYNHFRKHSSSKRNIRIWIIEVEWETHLVCRANNFDPSYFIGDSDLLFFFLSYPRKNIREITQIQREFLWGGGSDAHSKTPWVNWRDVCKDKSLGGRRGGLELET